MESKTLEELCAMARAMGLTGYSKLRKRELLALIKEKAVRRENSKPRAAPRRTEPKRETPRAKRAPRAPAVPKHAPAEPTARLMPQAAHISSAEERIEDAKFAVAPPGVALSPRPLAADLHEDIDRLPPLPEPLLCLLPQKPGILVAYWALTPGAAAQKPLKLRLLRTTDGAFELLEEIAVPGEVGQWYFHIGEDSPPGAFYLHLGFYDETGNFVTAIRRGVARIPSLYASPQIDRLWWISDEQFRAMYLRAGGFVRSARLGWAASVSSPGGAGHEQLARPGFISSRPK